MQRFGYACDIEQFFYDKNVQIKVNLQKYTILFSFYLFRHMQNDLNLASI